jgi:hypothetical protein
MKSKGQTLMSGAMLLLLSTPASAVQSGAGDQGMSADANSAGRPAEAETRDAGAREAKAEFEGDARKALDEMTGRYLEARSAPGRLRQLDRILSGTPEWLSETILERIARSCSKAGLQELLGFIGDLEDRGGTMLAVLTLRHPDKDLREEAALTLEVLADSRAVKGLLVAMRREKDRDVQASLLAALGTCGKGRKEVLDVLFRAARKGTAEQRAQALIALAPSASAETVVRAQVEAVLQDEDNREVKRAGEVALGVAPPVPRRLKKYERGDGYRDVIPRPPMGSREAGSRAREAKKGDNGIRPAGVARRPS